VGIAIESPERARLVQPARRATAWGSGSVWPISGRTFLIPKPAKYPLSIVSEYAVAHPELWIAPADSSKSTRRKGRSYFPQPRFGTTIRPPDQAKLAFQVRDEPGGFGFYQQ
jgi:hypothetical protein